jgi:hypothetical protein
MKTVARITLAALTIAASGTPMLAQGSAPMVLASATTTGPAVKTYDPAAMRARIAHADELWMEGNLSAARREFTAVAELQRSHNVLPAEAMWKLAELYHSDKSPKRAAAVLDALAADAEQFGDPKLQAKALLEAAVLYENARMPAQAVTCAKRLDLLMASPHITDEFRQEVQRRIVRK